MSQPNPNQSVREQLAAMLRYKRPKQEIRIDNQFGPLLEEDWTELVDALEVLLDQISAERETAAQKERNRILLALVGMYEQYCPGRLGHYFMGAGETAIEVIEDYGLGNEIDGIDDDAVAALRQPTGEVQCPDCKDGNAAAMVDSMGTPGRLDCPTCDGKGVLPAPQSTGEQR